MILAIIAVATRGKAEQETSEAGLTIERDHVREPKFFSADSDRSSVDATDGLAAGFGKQYYYWNAEWSAGENSWRRKLVGCSVCHFRLACRLCVWPEEMTEWSVARVLSKVIGSSVIRVKPYWTY